MCFTIGWLLQLLIWLIVLSGVIAIVKIWLLPMLAAGDPRIAQTVNVLIWVVVTIFIIYVIADLLICATGGGLGLRHW